MKKRIIALAHKGGSDEAAATGNVNVEYDTAKIASPTLQTQPVLSYKDDLYIWGNDEPHNTMPPYITVSMFRRTA